MLRAIAALVLASACGGQEGSSFESQSAALANTAPTNFVLGGIDSQTAPPFLTCTTATETTTVDGGKLQHDGGPLTSAVLISAIELELMRRGWAADGTIAAGGAAAADPHVSDSGQLMADEPVSRSSSLALH